MQRKTNPTTNNLDDWNLLRCFIPFALAFVPFHMLSKFLAVFFTALFSFCTTTDDCLFSFALCGAQIHMSVHREMEKTSTQTHSHQKPLTFRHSECAK